MTTGVPLGNIVCTAGVFGLPWAQTLRCIGYLVNHGCGDWGCVGPEDWAANDRAVQDGNRILSAYAIEPDQACKGWGDNCVWIITEADRSVTTILLPSEY